MWPCALLLLQAPQPAGSEGFGERMAPLLAAHCRECHSGPRAKGELDLSQLSAGVAADGAPAWREQLDSIRERLLAEEMPPLERPRPPAAQLESALDWLEQELPPVPSQAPTLLRMNRSQYERAVRDLFGVAYPARELFPADEVGALFDNGAASASASELAVERWVDAAERVALLALPADVACGTRVVALDEFEIEGSGSRKKEDLALYSSARAHVLHDFPRAGRYRLEFSGYGDQAGDEPPRLSVDLANKAWGTRDFENARGSTQSHALVIEAPVGAHEVGLSFVNDFYDPKADDQKRRDRNLHITDLSIVGPLDPLRATSFTQFVDEQLARGDFEAALAALGLRVWRRPLVQAEIQRLAALCASESAPRERLRLALVGLLASPNFLYRAEEGALDDFELATRLSFFLWASVPDLELLALAQENRLHQPDTRSAQVRRMLRDPRSRSLVEEFAAQWLGWRLLERTTPDPLLFPQADPALLSSMRQESEAFFEAMLREERPLEEFIDADFAFVDPRLAALYGIEGVQGEGLRRVRVADGVRGGLLGQAAILTATSNPTRTSPVKRGKWVLETLLGKHVPPPPPGVGVLEEKAAGLAPRTVREQLDLHRSNQDCASCHLRLDPLGFALESFDAIGRLRTHDGEFEVDDRGELADKRPLEGLAGLKSYLRESGDFPQALAAALLSYALGREPSFSERRELRRMLDALPPERRTLADLIEGLCSHSALAGSAAH